MSQRTWVFLFILIFFFSISGCYFAARSEMKAAEKSLAELKAAGGQTSATYEYCTAEKYLEISKLEANDSDWKAAKDFAARSKSAAEAGLAAAKKK